MALRSLTISLTGVFHWCLGDTQPGKGCEGFYIPVQHLTDFSSILMTYVVIIAKACIIRLFFRPANAFAVSYPMPELAPVITVYLFVFDTIQTYNIE